MVDYRVYVTYSLGLKVKKCVYVFMELCICVHLYMYVNIKLPAYLGESACYRNRSLQLLNQVQRNPVLFTQYILIYMSNDDKDMFIPYCHMCD